MHIYILCLFLCILYFSRVKKLRSTSLYKIALFHAHLSFDHVCSPFFLTPIVLERSLLQGARNDSYFSPKWGSYVRNGNLENKHSNLWWLLKGKIKHNQENLVKPHCKESYLLSLGSFVFRVLSFLVNLILLLKFSKHETGYLGNNKQQKREAQATSSYTCLPVTRNFAKEKQATSTLKLIKGSSESQDGFPLSPL